MYTPLFIGNPTITLNEINSTNVFMKKMLFSSKTITEGTVISAKNQTLGKGQMGNTWVSNPNENLTFSILLRPKITVKNQFILSKIISLGIVDFLMHKKIADVTIKWPNDIYIKSKKISGILIENTLSGSYLENSVIGIGFNVNQLKFQGLEGATSLKRVLNSNDFRLNLVLNDLLFFIEKRYLYWKNNFLNNIEEDYLKLLLYYNIPKKYNINGHIVTGVIKGIEVSGKLLIEINNELRSFDLKEVKFIIS